jgi:uncharacterized membrane protein
MSEQAIEISAYLTSFILIGSYHLYMRNRLRRERLHTIQSVNTLARTAWVENIMSDKSNGILAVQTLRNSTMAATFLASTAILLIMCVLNLIHNTTGDDFVLNAVKDGVLRDSEFGKFRLAILLLSFFWAFFCFSMAVRMYNHVGYIINATNSKRKFFPSTDYVSYLLNRSGRYYSMGMRSYFISVPLIFGLFNDFYLIAASVLLVAVLHLIDRTPDYQSAAPGSRSMGDESTVEHGSIVHIRSERTA